MPAKLAVLWILAMTSYLAIDKFFSLIMRQRPNNGLLTALDMVRQQAVLYTVRWRFFLPCVRIEMAGKRHVESL